MMANNTQCLKMKIIRDKVNNTNEIIKCNYS